MPLQSWQLDAATPYSLQLASDSRLSLTDYVDDQIWELLSGNADSPALTLQTKYGGRVGLTSIVPMWQLEERIIYQAVDYAASPVVTELAPNYLQLETRLMPNIQVTAGYWVMESHAIGGYFTVMNENESAVKLRLDLFGHVGAEKKSIPLAIISLKNGTHALSLGHLENIEPVVVLENANSVLVPGMKASPKIGTDLIIEPGLSQTIRWVHTGLGKMEASLERAQFWLNQDWDAAISLIKNVAASIPSIETGNPGHDTVIAFSYQTLMQSFLQPNTALPYSSFVATRQSDHGYSLRGDGTDYDRGWSGQSPHLAYLTALAVAPVDHQFAQGIVRNFLATQDESGWVDSKPGLAGQRQGLLCPPLLARLTWEIYQYTEDVAFLAEVFPSLLRFLNRWSALDQEVKGDIVPEWHDERQIGYTFFPTFAVGQSWAQNLNIQKVESPDMAAYLLSELDSLAQMAEILGDAGVYELRNRREQLNRDLNKFWNEQLSRYVYLDSETHLVSTPVTLVENVRVDDEIVLQTTLDLPARLLICVSGGTGKPPRATLHLQGVDAKESPLVETIDLKDFVWSYGQGVYTTQKVYAKIDQIKFEGLSRVYQVNVQTIDLTRFDINSLMPLWFSGLSKEQVEQLAQSVMNEKHFLRRNGLTIVSAQDENFDAASKNGGGGTWAFWTTVIGEGLISHGYSNLAAELLERLVDTQVEVLKRQKRFSEFYHSDQAGGLGESGYLSGIVPLHLLMKVLGIKIVNAGRVWIGSSFAWKTPVTIRQYEVIVRRTSQETIVEFPSGHRVNLSADAPEQFVVDPSPVKIENVLSNIAIVPPDSNAVPAKRVIIEVQQNPTDDK